MQLKFVRKPVALQWERDSNGNFKENIEVSVDRRLEAPDGEVIEVEVDEPDWR
jgi:hypothetical protein